MEFITNIRNIVNETKNIEGITEQVFLKECEKKGLNINYPETFLNIYWREKCKN